jgi:hypothetical protein
MKIENTKLEDSKLWKNIFEVAKQIFIDIEALAEDDKYPYGYDLKADASSALHTAAEAAGSIDPRDQVWQLGIVRSKLFGLKSTLKLTYGVQILPANPELMVLLDESIKLIDANAALAPKLIRDWHKLFDTPPKNSGQERA